jgi:hypothetical protein
LIESRCQIEVGIVAVKFLYVATGLLVLQSWPAAAADQNCMTSYYRTKPPACVDIMLSQLRQSGGDPSAVIGFLAYIFSTSSEEKRRILHGEASQQIQSMDLVALYRAGLLDDARKFADKYQLTAQLQKLEAGRPAPLATVIPSSTPADNDLLIGAYMASGDTAFIARILENFSNADDGMVSDAMRLGFMNSKFGPSFTAQGRENVMAPAACEKYQCKTDRAKFFRVLTLSSAFWALQSLAQQDDGIKRTFNDFFANDARLKNLHAVEQVAFGNYLTALAFFAAFRPDQGSGNVSPGYEGMRKSALAYESLEPAGKVFQPIEGSAKSGNK